MASRGYTLVEMLIVLAFLGVAAAVLLPARAPNVEARLDAARAEVAAALRFARDESLRTGEVFGVRIHTAESRVRVFRADLSTNPPTPIYDVVDPISKRLWDVVFEEDRRLRGIDLDRSMTWRGVCNADRFVVFRDAGTPSCRDPLAVLLDSGLYTVALDGVSRDVALDGFSGRVTQP